MSDEIKTEAPLEPAAPTPTQPTEIQEPTDKQEPLIDPLAPGLMPPPTITEEEKEKFWKCFLADDLYAEKISLLGGKFVVEFRALSVEENNDVLRQINVDQQKGLAQNNDSYFVYILQYRIGASLVSINNLPFLPDVTKDKVPLNLETGDFYIKRKAAAFDKWAAFKLAAVNEAFRAFEHKLNHLTKEVNNETFWKAAV